MNPINQNPIAQTPIISDNTQNPIYQQSAQPMAQQQPMATPQQPTQQPQAQPQYADPYTQQQPQAQPMYQTPPMAPPPQSYQPMAQTQPLPAQDAYQQPAQQYQQPMQPQQQYAPAPAPIQPAAQAQPQQMPQLTDGLLVQFGFGAMPFDARTALLNQMKQTLEMRVGMEIYKHMREDQLKEFEGLMPANDEQGNVILSVQEAEANSVTWLSGNMPGWQSSPTFAPYANQPGAVLQFAALNWLQRNFPSYRDVVSKELNGLLEEVKRDKDAIMGTIAPAAAPMP